jgi:hypothetical protein
LGERIFKSPGGRGRSWKRTRRRKRDRRTIGIADCGLRPSFAPATPGLRRVKIAECTDQRIMIKRIPSSIIEKAQSSMEPKAMGVKIIRRMRIYLIK